MLTEKDSPIVGLVLGSQILGYLCFALLWIANWKTGVWVTAIKLKKTETHSLWSNCLTAMYHPSGAADCNVHLSNFVQTVFIFSACAQVAACLVGTTLFYQMHCNLSLKVGLLVAFVLQFLAMFCSLLCWTLVWGNFPNAASAVLLYPSLGLQLEVAFWVFSLVATILYAAAVGVNASAPAVVAGEAPQKPTAEKMQSADKLYLVAVVFAGLLSACSWGAVYSVPLLNSNSTAMPTPTYQSQLQSALTVLLLAFLLTATSIALALAHGLLSHSRTGTTFGGMITMAVLHSISWIILGLAIRENDFNQWYFMNFGGFILGMIAASGISLGCLAQAHVSWKSKDQVPLGGKILISRIPKLTSDLLYTAIVFAIITMDLVYPHLFYSVNAPITTVSFLDGSQLFASLSFLFSMASFIMYVLAAQEESPIRTSTAVLAAWLLQLCNFWSIFIVCLITPNAFSAFGCIAAPISLICGAIAWNQVRLGDNPRKGNVCTVFGRPCCARGVCENKGLCAPGECLYSAQSYDNSFVPNDPELAAARRALEFEKVQLEYAKAKQEAAGASSALASA